MRKLIYHVGVTLDSFIGHEDGSASEGFINEGEHVTEYQQSLLDYDTVIMGKATYEYGYQFGLQPGQPAYPHMKHYIFSKTIQVETAPGDQVEVVRKNEIGFIKQLKASEGTPIYLCGGSKFAGFLLEQELIDELKIKLYPVVFGKGLPLFKSDKSVQLSLLDSKRYDTGVMLLTYQMRY
ncbi:dihydrofolate reductase family protein [Spirosoma fluminis]